MPRLPRHRSCDGIREVIPGLPPPPHAHLATIQSCLAPKRLLLLRLLQYDCQQLMDRFVLAVY